MLPSLFSIKSQLFFLMSLTSISANSIPSSPAATALLSKDTSTLYLYLPSSATSSRTRLVSIPLNASFSVDDISASFTELPPLPLSSTETDTELTITPLLVPQKKATGDSSNTDEKLFVFTSSCSSNLSLYEFIPSLDGSSKTWKQQDLRTSSTSSQDKFLLPRGSGGGAFAFMRTSTTTSVPPESTFMKGGSNDADLHAYELGLVTTTTKKQKIYLFGGTETQCKRSGITTTSRYSNVLTSVELLLSKTVSHNAGPSKKNKGKQNEKRDEGERQMTAAVVSEDSGAGKKGEWPIPEAGFSMTVIPGSSERVVMIGGHAEDAFVGMKQVAVYEGSEERWKFVDAAMPAGAAAVEEEVEDDKHEPKNTTKTTTDKVSSTSTLSRRASGTVRIDSRSGHSAVVTEDGKRVIIYGGWVGDTDTPAEPRMIILELATEGGKEKWNWKIPSKPTVGDMGPPTDDGKEGIWGHAAAMLDGDIMFITGGYKISPGSKGRRSSLVEASAKTFLYNFKSNSWVTTYQPSSRTSKSSSSSANPMQEKEAAKDKKRKKKTATAVGVSLGLTAIVAIIIAACLWNSRRQKRKSILLADEERHISRVTTYIKQLPTRRNATRTSNKQPRPHRFPSRETTPTLPRSGTFSTMYRSTPATTPDQRSPRTPFCSSSGTPPTPSEKHHSPGHLAAMSRSFSFTAISPIPEQQEEEYQNNPGSGSPTSLRELYHHSLAFATRLSAHENSIQPVISEKNEWEAALPLQPRPAFFSLPNSSSGEDMAYPNYNTPGISPAALPPILRVNTAPARSAQKSRNPYLTSTTTSTNTGDILPFSYSSTTATAPPKPPPQQPAVKKWSTVSALRKVLPSLSLPQSSTFSLHSATAAAAVAPTPKTTEYSAYSAKRFSEFLNEQGLRRGRPISSSVKDVRCKMDWDYRRSGLEDEEWDLEKAVERRIVQVMFTAPKGELRVVNLDVDGNPVDVEKDLGGVKIV